MLLPITASADEAPTVARPGEFMKSKVPSGATIFTQSGLVSTIGGAVVLVYPEATIVVVTWLAGIVLVVSGVVVLIDGLVARRADRRHAPSSVARPGRAAIG